MLGACGDDESGASIDAIVSDEPPGLGETIDSIRVTVSVLSTEGETQVGTYEHAAELREGRLVPWSVRLTPRSQSDVGRTLYRVKASGLRGGAEIVSTQHRLVFVPNRRLVLALRLDGDCVGTRCAVDQRCSDATCESDFIPACTLVVGTRPDDCRNGDEMDAGSVADMATASIDASDEPTSADATPPTDSGPPPLDGASTDDDGATALDSATEPDAATADASMAVDAGSDAFAPDAFVPRCTGPECDDGNPCTTDTCEPSTGCSHASNAADCDDGTFCNGTDRCGGGTCSVHAGLPCDAPAVCDESMDRCVGCVVDDDCGPDVPDEWGPCEGFTSTCDEWGLQRRNVTELGCVAAVGACINTGAHEDVQECFLSTAGVSCGAGATCVAGNCCGDGACMISFSENGLRCPSDCCDGDTPCGVTRSSDPSQYCRSLNGGPFQWITEAQALLLCDSPGEICATSYTCGGTSGFCVIDGIYTYREGPCSAVCGNGRCDAGETGASCGTDCCDSSSACGSTFGGFGELYCRSFDGGPYEWITAADALEDHCSTAAHVGGTYACVGETGFCCSPGVFAPMCP